MQSRMPSMLKDRGTPAVRTPLALSSGVMRLAWNSGTNLLVCLWTHDRTVGSSAAMVKDYATGSSLKGISFKITLQRKRCTCKSDLCYNSCANILAAVLAPTCREDAVKRFTSYLCACVRGQRGNGKYTSLGNGPSPLVSPSFSMCHISQFWLSFQHWFVLQIQYNWWPDF